MSCPHWNMLNTVRVPHNRQLAAATLQSETCLISVCRTSHDWSPAKCLVEAGFACLEVLSVCHSQTMVLRYTTCVAGTAPAITHGFLEQHVPLHSHRCLQVTCSLCECHHSGVNALQRPAPCSWQEWFPSNMLYLVWQRDLGLRTTPSISFSQQSVPSLYTTLWPAWLKPPEQHFCKEHVVLTLRHAVSGWRTTLQGDSSAR